MYKFLKRNSELFFFSACKGKKPIPGALKKAHLKSDSL
jgi:hypothetical protein